MPVPLPPGSVNGADPSSEQDSVSIDILLRTVPDKPSTVQTHLAAYPALACAADSTGYSLLHAAASYGQAELLRDLVCKYNVSPNLTDLENETPLFAAETLAIVQLLVEELGADVSIKNEEGLTAENQALENVEEGENGEWVLIADYLERARCTRDGNAAGEGATQLPRTGDMGEASISTNEIRQPPPVPEGIEINFGTMDDPAAMEGEPDPEFRRRIEELASREDFQGPDGQAALRELVRDAMGGLAADRGVRRRMD